MSMICPQCHGVFEQSVQCPTCRVRLHYQAHTAGPESAAQLPEGQWQHTPWGRIAVGVLVAQGLTFGLQLLCNAGLLAASDDPTRTIWATIFGLVLLQALQAISLIVGGALTGATQQRGMLLGFLVGLISGPVFVVIQKLNGEPLTDVAMYGQPILALIFGTLGGLIGSAIWKPLPTLRMPGPAQGGSNSKRIKKSSLSVLDGPIAWGRVALGIAIGVPALLWPRPILDFLVDASKGTIRVQSQLQAQMIAWEIAGLCTLLAGAFAGATTSNGLKQGLCVGLGVVIALLGIHFGSPAASLEKTVFMTSSALALTVAGGWFGGQLFPPILARRRRRATL